MAVIATTPVNIEANVETFKAWPAKIVVLIIMFIITAFILSKTLLGKYNKAIGEMRSQPSNLVLVLRNIGFWPIW